MDTGLSGGIAALTVLAAVLLVAIARARSRRQALSRLAAALDAGELKPGRVYEAEHEGTAYEYVYRPGTRGSPSSLVISLRCPSRGEFKVTRESRLDALFKRLGISVELQTGDSSFDRELYIQTDSVEFARAYFADYDKREALQKIIQSGFANVTHDGQVVQTVIRPFSPKSLQDGTLVGETVNRLRVLTEDLPMDYQEPRLLGVPAWKLRRALAYGSAAAALAGGLAAMIYGLYAFRPLDLGGMLRASLDYSVPALGVFLGVAIAMLRGRSSSHRELMRVALLALPGLPLLGFGGLMVLNGYLDTSGASYHQALVLGARRARSKDSTDYYLLLKSWRPGHRTEELTVSDATYRRVRVGRSMLIVTTHPGRYGFEWIEHYRVAGPPGP